MSLGDSGSGWIEGGRHPSGPPGQGRELGVRTKGPRPLPPEPRLPGLFPADSDSYAGEAVQARAGAFRPRPAPEPTLSRGPQRRCPPVAPAPTCALLLAGPDCAGDDSALSPGLHRLRRPWGSVRARAGGLQGQGVSRASPFKTAQMAGRRWGTPDSVLRLRTRGCARSLRASLPALPGCWRLCSCRVGSAAQVSRVAALGFPARPLLLLQATAGCRALSRDSSLRACQKPSPSTWELAFIAPPRTKQSRNTPPNHARN